jgi:hypothetical protein
MATDALRAEVEIGDWGVYVTSGRYTTRGVVEVLDVKKRVRVRWLKADTYVTENDKVDGFWIEPGSLFLANEFKGEVKAQL